MTDLPERKIFETVIVTLILRAFLIAELQIQFVIGSWCLYEADNEGMMMGPF